MNLTYTPFQKKIIQTFNLSNTTSFLSLGSLFDTLIVDKFMGRPLPSGFSASDLDNLQHIHNWINNLKYSGVASKVANTGKFSKVLS